METEKKTETIIQSIDVIIKNPDKFHYGIFFVDDLSIEALKAMYNLGEYKVKTLDDEGIVADFRTDIKDLEYTNSSKILKVADTINSKDPYHHAGMAASKGNHHSKLNTGEKYAIVKEHFDRSGHSMSENIRCSAIDLTNKGVYWMFSRDRFPKLK